MAYSGLKVSCKPPSPQTAHGPAPADEPPRLARASIPEAIRSCWHHRFPARPIFEFSSVDAVCTAHFPTTTSQPALSPCILARGGVMGVQSRALRPVELPVRALQARSGLAVCSPTTKRDWPLERHILSIGLHLPQSDWQFWSATWEGASIAFEWPDTRG